MCLYGACRYRHKERKCDVTGRFSSRPEFSPSAECWQWPGRPLRVIVPYPPAGGADTTARIVYAALSEQFGQQFAVENRGGAGGTIGEEVVAKAAPDGYTLLMTGNNTAIATALFKSLPFNVLNDFASVSTASFFDLLIVTRAGSPLHTVGDLIKAAQANPGKLNIGTIVPGSTQNLAALLFNSTTGIKATVVTFRTSPDMANAVLRGDVDVAFEFYAAVHGFLDSEKMVVLASTGAKRTAYLPNVPTVIESGIKDYDVVSWNGLSVPAKTPKTIIDTLNAAMKAVMPDPDIQAKAQAVGMEMRASTPEDMTARMKADIAKWGDVIAKAGIQERD